MTVLQLLLTEEKQWRHALLGPWPTTMRARSCKLYDRSACARPCTSRWPSLPAGDEHCAAPVPALTPPGSQRGPCVARPVAAAPEPPAEQQQQPGERPHAAHSCGPRSSALPPAGACG